MWVSTEKYCNSPKLLDAFTSTLLGVFNKNPWLNIPSGYVCPTLILALHLCIISFTSMFVSKSSPFKNCWVPKKLLPVYQVPPPGVRIEELNIDPVPPPLPKLSVASVTPAHSVAVVELFLYVQETPLDPIGKFKYFPVPSSQDWDTAYAFTICVDTIFLASAIDSCKFTDEDKDEVKLLSPINDIVFIISSFLNLIKILEG